MEPLAAIFSASGRLAPKPFWIGAIAIYLASFCTQFLLAAPMMARASVIPFVAVQGICAWIWYALHARRLRDAGRPIGSAVALSVLYGLAIALLLLVVVAVSAPVSSPAPAGAEQPPSGSIFDLFLLLFIVGLVFGQPDLGIFVYILTVALVLLLLPILIGFGFTVWVGTRPRAPVQP